MSLPSFKDPSLLLRALTHRSYLNEHPDTGEDNERLEFLGDAVVDLVASAILYHRYPDMREGRLTRLRAALVRTEQLADFAAALEIGARLRLGKGEAETGGRERLTLLCDGFEAVVGAYYLDSGLEAVRQFVEPILVTAADHILQAEKDVDSKSQLQEWAQAERSQTPSYRTVAVTGPDHNREFTVEVALGDEVMGSGAGRNKQAAAQAAAEAALRKAGQL